MSKPVPACRVNIKYYVEFIDLAADFFLSFFLLEEIMENFIITLDVRAGVLVSFMFDEWKMDWKIK